MTVSDRDIERINERFDKNETKQDKIIEKQGNNDMKIALLRKDHTSFKDEIVFKIDLIIKTIKDNSEKRKNRFMILLDKFLAPIVVGVVLFILLNGRVQ